MKKYGFISGQKINSLKVDFAREMRKSMTGAEKRLWADLRNRQLGGFKFRRQQIIDGFIVDFYCAEGKLVIEADGGSHIGREEYDSMRDTIFMKRGLRVIRFSNAEIEANIKEVLNRILRLLTSSPGYV